MNPTQKPNQALTRQDQIKPLLAAAHRQITSLLQDEVKAKKFTAAALVVASDPLLAKCSADSIVQALIGVAMSDLNIDKNIGHVYLVPYGDKVQLQIGYKGMIQLLFRSGWLVKSFPAYQCDHFEMAFDGWDNKIEFIPEIDRRDEGDKDWVYQNIRGVYVVARHADTKDEYSTFVNKTVIEKLRLNSPNQKISQWTKPDDKKRLEQGLPIGIWHDWYVEMAQAKAIKKLAKILPIGDSRVASAISIDDKSEIGKTVDYKATAESGVIIEMNTDDQDSIDSSSSAVTIDSITAKIEAAQSQKELDALVKDLEAMSAADKKILRVAWMNRLTALKKQQATESEPPKTTEPTMDDWKNRVLECGDAETLTQLLNDMPEAVKNQLAEAIDTHYDMMRCL